MRKLPRWREVVLAFASIVVTLLIAEVAARAILPMPPTVMAGFNLRTSEYYVADAELGWVPAPSVQGRHDQEGSFETSFSTNSLGLRDSEVATDREDGRTRVVALGDSFTWGWGVDDDELFARVIERLDSSMEVVNLGVTAYGVHQSTEYLQRVGLQFDPDVVLFSVVMNDVIDPMRPRPDESPEEWMSRIAPDPVADEAPAPTRSGLSAIKGWLVDSSILYRAFTDVVNSSRGLSSLFVRLGLKGPPAGLEGLDPNLHPFLTDYPPQVARAVERTEEELLRLNEVVAASGSRLVLAIVPTLQSVDARARRNSIARTRFTEADFDLDRPYRWLTRFGTSHDIPVVNPVEAFRAAHGEGTELYLRFDMHFNDVGHELFAAEVVEQLQRLEPTP